MDPTPEDPPPGPPARGPDRDRRRRPRSRSGTALRMPTQLTANDISRYCTVWSLLERGTLCHRRLPLAEGHPGQGPARPDPFSKQVAGSRAFYSSKPPLFATLMAGMIYPFRKLSGVPLDATVKQVRVERNVEKEVQRLARASSSYVKETPPPVIWPAYHRSTLKPAIILFNVVPFACFLILYAGSSTATPQ